MAEHWRPSPCIYLHLATRTAAHALTPSPHHLGYNQSTMSTDTDSDLVLQRTRTARIACDDWNPIPYWIATGTVMAYACSALMAIGGLNIHDLNVIYITSVFIPVR